MNAQLRPAPSDLACAFAGVRVRTDALAAPLSAEDAMVQSMPDASPAKWHLAHTTWFFETFVLGAIGVAPVDERFGFLFNSYYQGVGPMHARAQRGLVSRPTLDEVRDYRARVDAAMHEAFARDAFDADLRQRITLGLHHEQQHQELLLTDIQHAFWCNPLKPAYAQAPAAAPRVPVLASEWVAHDEAVLECGAAPWPAQAAFAFDNESPRHRVLVPAHAIATRLVTCAQVRAFIDDGGYRTASLWLSAGWAQVQAEGWTQPLYWDIDHDRRFGLHGWQPLDDAAPAWPLSYFEADAIARWLEARLPTEFEWEQAAVAQPVVHHDALAPFAATSPDWFGQLWQWTSSAYGPYPGFAAMPGALGEYNGKFMCGQYVLRGASVATAPDHARASYRNFFQPPDRWQFSGLRLARDLT